MTYAAVAAPWLLVLALLWALLQGQPAGHQDNLDRISAQSTENAGLRAALYARGPTNTPYAKYCLPQQMC